MDPSLVLFQQAAPGISLVTLNRPEKRNAFDANLLQAFISVLERISLDSSQRVMILKAEGSFFCSGMDLSKIEADSTYLIPKALKALYTLPVITCALIQGGALAGGAGIISCCDFAIAEEKARFGCPEIHRGFVAANIMPFLIRKIGYRNTRNLVLQAQLISSQRAFEIGLIDTITSSETLLEEGMTFAEAALQGAPRATRFTKNLLNDLYPTSIEEDLKKVEKFSPHSIPQDEPQEGMAAFLEKRKPSWVP